VRDLTASEFPFLASLAASDRTGDRHIWLRVAADHFVAARPADPEKRAAFVGAMIGALKAADPETRAEIARKLAPSPATPTALLAWFAEAGPELSDLMLERAAGFAETELLRAANRGGRSAAAVARRADLTRTLVDTLGRLDEIEALLALAGNPSAPLEGAILARLARTARRSAEAGDRRLADALLARRPLEPECAILFLEAHPPERVEILLAAQRNQLGRPPGPTAPVDEAALERLENAAVGRHPELFVPALAEALGCGDDLARRIVADPSGEPLAVALASLGAPNDTLVRVLISNDLAAGGYRRIRALARLNTALNRAAASAVMAALRDRSETVERVPLRATGASPRPFDKARAEGRRAETTAPGAAKPAASSS
jgi:uncharacterized protein (DUF2336 family)